MQKQSSPNGSKNQRAPSKLSTRRRINTLLRETQFTPHVQWTAIEEYLIALDSAMSLSCLILFRHGEYTQLVNKDLNPLNYEDYNSFCADFAAISFLRKCAFLETGIDKREVALTAFRASEEACKVTNGRFRNLSSDPLYTGTSVWLLHALSRKIEQILGSFSIDGLFDMGSWGPGVTTLTKGKDVSASRKFREESGITSNAYRVLKPLLPLAYPHWFTSEKLEALVIQDANVVITVPKNAKTDRTIAIEPGLNSWFQLGMGKLIRNRLRLAGFDLKSDKMNQKGAYIGSKFGTLATVDFSSASDTISKKVTEEILPPKWFAVMDLIRSQSYTLDGEHSRYEKFSAMGNGFTFELESLIFVASALCVCDYLGLDSSQVSVFGDDIILPIEGMDLYFDFCKFLGFTVNPKKSFSSGYFRESCGSYYFKGLNVKPLFFKEGITNALSIYKLLNQVRLVAHRRNQEIGCSASYYPLWKFLVRTLPKDLRILGERSAGDGCIHSNFDECRPSLARNGWSGFLHSAFVSHSVDISDDNSSLLLARLWRRSTDRDYGNSIPLRSVTRISLKTDMFAPRWYNFGPWY